MIKSILILIIIVFISIFIITNVYSEETKYKTYTDIGPLEKTELTIVGVISDPDKFHREIITVEGEISKIEYKKLITGKRFTMFILEDKQENKIKVYARGYIKELKMDQKLEFMEGIVKKNLSSSVNIKT